MSIVLFGFPLKYGFIIVQVAMETTPDPFRSSRLGETQALNRAKANVRNGRGRSRLYAARAVLNMRTMYQNDVLYYNEPSNRMRWKSLTRTL